MCVLAMRLDSSGPVHKSNFPQAYNTLCSMMATGVKRTRVWAICASSRLSHIDKLARMGAEVDAAQKSKLDEFRAILAATRSGCQTTDDTVHKLLAVLQLEEAARTKAHEAWFWVKEGLESTHTHPDDLFAQLRICHLAVTTAAAYEAENYGPTIDSLWSQVSSLDEDHRLGAANIDTISEMYDEYNAYRDVTHPVQSRRDKCAKLLQAALPPFVTAVRRSADGDLASLKELQGSSTGVDTKTEAPAARGAIDSVMVYINTAASFSAIWHARVQEVDKAFVFDDTPLELDAIRALVDDVTLTIKPWEDANDAYTQGLLERLHARIHLPNYNDRAWLIPAYTLLQEEATTVYIASDDVKARMARVVGELQTMVQRASRAWLDTNPIVNTVGCWREYFKHGIKGVRGADWAKYMHERRTTALDTATVYLDRTLLCAAEETELRRCGQEEAVLQVIRKGRKDLCRKLFDVDIVTTAAIAEHAAAQDAAPQDMLWLETHRPQNPASVAEAAALYIVQRRVRVNRYAMNNDDLRARYNNHANVYGKHFSNTLHLVFSQASICNSCRDITYTLESNSMTLEAVAKCKDGLIAVHARVEAQWLGLLELREALPLVLHPAEHAMANKSVDAVSDCWSTSCVYVANEWVRVRAIPPKRSAWVKEAGELVQLAYPKWRMRHLLHSCDLIATTEGWATEHSSIQLLLYALKAAKGRYMTVTGRSLEGWPEKLKRWEAGLPDTYKSIEWMYTAAGHKQACFEAIQPVYDIATAPAEIKALLAQAIGAIQGYTRVKALHDKAMQEVRLVPALREQLLDIKLLSGRNFHTYKLVDARQQLSAVRKVAKLLVGVTRAEIARIETVVTNTSDNCVSACKQVVTYMTACVSELESYTQPDNPNQDVEVCVDSLLETMDSMRKTLSDCGSNPNMATVSEAVTPHYELAYKHTILPTTLKFIGPWLHGGDPGEAKANKAIGLCGHLALHLTLALRADQPEVFGALEQVETLFGLVQAAKVQTGPVSEPWAIEYLHSRYYDAWEKHTDVRYMTACVVYLEELANNPSAAQPWGLDVQYATLRTRALVEAYNAIYVRHSTHPDANKMFGQYRLLLTRIEAAYATTGPALKAVPAATVAACVAYAQQTLTTDPSPSVDWVTKVLFARQRLRELDNTHACHRDIDAALRVNVLRMPEADTAVAAVDNIDTTAEGWRDAVLEARMQCDIVSGDIDAHRLTWDQRVPVLRMVDDDMRHYNACLAVLIDAKLRVRRAADELPKVQ